MKRSTAMAGCLLLVAIFAILVYPKNTQPTIPYANRTASVIKAPVIQDNVVKFPPAYKWDEISREELDEFAALFHDESSRKGYEINTVVKSGESIVTGIYEARPGEFIFSRLTPRLTKDGDGNPTVTVEVDSIGVSDDGVRDQFAKAKQTYPGSFYQLSSRDAQGNYLISLQTEIIDGDDLRIKSKGEYQKYATPIPRDGRSERQD